MRVSIGIGIAVSLLAAASPARADLDVVFVLDTTGSMGAELGEAKARVGQIAEALTQARPGERLRFGVVAFRDRKDAFVTRQSPLSEGIDAAQAFIRTLSAGGGGDTPEDVLAALRVAIEDMDWAQGAEHRVFLVGDAPPHFYPDGPFPEALIRVALERRVVVDTIGCRSLGAEGRRFFRSFAYATEGRYQHIGRVSDEGAGVTSSVMKSLLRGDERGVELQHTVRAVPTDHARLGAWLAAGGCRVELVPPRGLGEVLAVRFSEKESRLTIEVGPSEGLEQVGLRVELGRCVPALAAVEMEVRS